MLSPLAAPKWAGELFYKSITGGGTNDTSGVGSTSASEIMQSADWQNQLPSFAQPIVTAGLMVSETTHNTSIAGSPSVWRPMTFNGSNNAVGSLSSITPAGSTTGGYVADGPQGASGTHYYKNTMAWSGRPTHYYDFSQSQWVRVADNHTENIQALPLGNWKASEYCWHARALGVTIYTVGYGTLVYPDQQVFLAQLANATTTTAGGGTASPTIPPSRSASSSTPPTRRRSATISIPVGQAINEALTGGH